MFSLARLRLHVLECTRAGTIMHHDLICMLALVLQLHDMKSQQTLHSQKQMRLEATIAQQLTDVSRTLPGHGLQRDYLIVVARAQVKQLRTSITNMHGDVVRLNALIAQNEGMSKKLAEANFSLEKEFVVELKVCPLGACGCLHW